MSLFKPAWQSNNVKKALKAVEKETDQTKLFEIYLNAPVVDIQNIAINKITDQSLLARIPRYNLYNDEQFAVVKRITSQTTLKELSIFISKQYNEYNRPDSSYLDTLMKRIDEVMNMISDQNILAEIAKESKYPSSVKAVEMITDHSILKQLTKSQFQDYMARDTVIQKIANQDILESIATNNAYYDGAMAATVNITNQDALKRIATRTSDYLVRVSVVERIEDKDFFIALKKERCHQWAEYQGCTKRCAICGDLKGEHHNIEISSDYYSGRTEYKCTICGHTSSEYTSMGHG